ncbi:hypothetical protein PSPO01_02301 [Paraphaeosphaeria sporulosa]
MVTASQPERSAEDKSARASASHLHCVALLDWAGCHLPVVIQWRLKIAGKHLRRDPSFVTEWPRPATRQAPPSVSIDPSPQDAPWLAPHHRQVQATSSRPLLIFKHKNVLPFFCYCIALGRNKTARAAVISTSTSQQLRTGRA